MFGLHEKMVEPIEAAAKVNVRSRKRAAPSFPKG